ncbi:immunity 49 family protein [Saccharopolyspora shandongensis]|uniref:immunity 49 family protein n=1 Tax=Saccharopolyspora shandongensis TaxID=418495 RepID=UPI0034219332
MTSIVRHASADSSTADEITDSAEGVDMFLSRAARNTRQLRNVSDQSLITTCYRVLLDTDAEEQGTYTGLLLSAEAGAGFFAAANRPEEEFEYTVGTSMTLHHIEPTESHGPNTWLNSLWASVICRGHNLVEDLFQVPVEMLREGGGTFDEYMYAWIATLQGYFRGDDVYAQIDRSIELTDPEALQFGSPEVVLLRYFPAMKLLYNIAANEPDKFNENLAEAAELHRRFWTANDERSSNPDGFLALSLTALAAIAHDNGIQVEVSSEYLPRNFVTGFWSEDAA